MLDDPLAIGIRVVERPDDEALRPANLRAGPGLKLPDRCALDTALVTGSALATFDEHLAETARRRHLTVAPAAGPQPPQSW
jgi:predicted nucleic acid-binding protein